MRSSAVVALALLGVLAGPLVAYADTAGTPSGLVSVELKDVPVTQAIDTLFEGQGLKYYIQPGVKGRIVELKLKGITFDEALSALGDAVGFSYRIDNGSYVISPGRAAKPAEKVATTEPVTAYVPALARGPDPGPARVQQPPAPPPVVVNNNFTVPEQQASYGPPAGFGGYPYPPFYNIGGMAYQGGFYPAISIGSGPYVFGRFPQPPPPRGWVSADQERLLRFQYSVPRLPGYIAPYPYFRP